jgi:aminoglycoside phosphotransferase (APT) family kinase protein
MCAGKMHDDEADIDDALVRRLLTAQFPQWADLPIKRVASDGTVNAMYRLGEDMAVRLPLPAEDYPWHWSVYRWLAWAGPPVWVQGT